MHYIIAPRELGDTYNGFYGDQENGDLWYEPAGILEFDTGSDGKDTSTWPTLNNKYRTINPAADHTGQNGNNKCTADSGYENWYCMAEDSYSYDVVKIPEEVKVSSSWANSDWGKNLNLTAGDTVKLPSGNYTLLLRWDGQNEQSIFALCYDIEINGSDKPSCVVENCSDCDNGTDATCNNCKSGYFLENSSTCTACGDNCDACSSATECTTCSNGYFLDGGSCTTCKVDIEKCTTCASLTTCGACESGYTPSSDGTSCDLAPPGPQTCSEIFPNCSTCNAELTKCTSCISGYTLTDGSCIKDGSDTTCGFPNSVQDSPTHCSCVWPYIPSDNKYPVTNCDGCYGKYEKLCGGCGLTCGTTPILNCQQCDRKEWHGNNADESWNTKCQVCINGYTLNSTGSACTADNPDPPPSVTCDEPPNCKTCSSDNICSKCEDNYTLDTAKNTCTSSTPPPTSKCTTASDIVNCYECTSDQSACKTCQGSCTLSGDGQSCSAPLSAGVRNSSSSSEEVCGSCAIPHCDECDSYNSTSCTKCSTGYGLISSNTCSKTIVPPSPSTIPTCSDPSALENCFSYSNSVFKNVADGNANFCTDYSFSSGDSTPVICAGGAPDYGGGSCSTTECDQTYIFTTNGEWLITPGTGAASMSPSRSFMYLYDMGQDQNLATNAGTSNTLSFDFIWPEKVGVGYTYMLFWTDGQNFLWVQEASNGSTNLFFFPTGWSDDGAQTVQKITPGDKYTILVQFVEGGQVNIKLLNSESSLIVESKKGGWDFPSGNGPQIGVYAYSQSPGSTSDGLYAQGKAEYTFSNMCIGCVDYDSYTSNDDAVEQAL